MHSSRLVRLQMLLLYSCPTQYFRLQIAFYTERQSKIVGIISGRKLFIVNGPTDQHDHSHAIHTLFFSAVFILQRRTECVQENIHLAVLTWPDQT